MSECCDVVVVGAGMVGAAFACAATAGGLQVRVLDNVAPQPANGRGEYDLRVSAITRASQRLFQNLGAWETMAGLRVSPFREMHVWDAGGRGAIHFDSAEVGEPTLGHIVENRVVQTALLQRLAELDPSALQTPVRIVRLAVEPGQVRVELDKGEALSAGLVVGADGANSLVRREAGIAIRGWSYDQRALVATVRPEKHHRETAWQRFLPGGPLAFLPLGDGRCSIVWSTNPEHAQQLLDLEEDAFRQALAEAFDHRLGVIEHCGPRAAFPLRLQHSLRYVAPRLALIGDAAHTVHPLAGQGVNLGLLDAAALAEVLKQARSRGRAPGALETLRRYERWRKGENLASMAVMDGFKRLFGTGAAPVRLLRNLGLQAFDAAAPLKNAIIRRAMGLSGDLPALCRSGGAPEQSPARAGRSGTETQQF